MVTDRVAGLRESGESFRVDIFSGGRPQHLASLYGVFLFLLCNEDASVAATVTQRVNLDS